MIPLRALLERRSRWGGPSKPGKLDVARSKKCIPTRVVTHGLDPVAYRDELVPDAMHLHDPGGR